MSSAARPEKLGSPTNPDTRVGPAYLRAHGGAFNVDCMDIAHVIFNGVEIHYSGAAVKLEDVFFLNCTFVIDNVDRGRLLAQEILTFFSVNFS
jgi:hypothetical protein